MALCGQSLPSLLCNQACHCSGMCISHNHTHTEYKVQLILRQIRDTHTHTYQQKYTDKQLQINELSVFP